MGQFPSAVLTPLGPRRARLTAVLWWLLFGFAIVAIVGGVWRSIEEYRHPTGFEKVGLRASRLGPCVMVSPNSPLATAAWPDTIDPDEGACITRVNGQTVGPAMPREAVGELLDQPAGSELHIRLAGEQEDSVFRVGDVGGWYETGKLVAYALVGLLYAGVAFMLRRRRRDDRVFMRMSFVFLLMLHYGDASGAFWAWVGDVGLGLVLVLAGLMLLITTLPAFPTGVYVPRAARWIRLVVPLIIVGALIESNSGEFDWFTPAMLGMMFLAVGLLVLRYFRLPNRLERQQIKWAVFGISIGLFMLLIEDIVPAATSLSEGDPTLSSFATALFEWVTILGLGMIPAGVAISLFEYRLNDADAATGKSLGYLIVTMIVGAVGTVVPLVVGDFAKRMSDDPRATTAITAVVVALIFTPARSFVLAWTEAKFQPALVRLRKLPEKLARLQTCQTADELAGAALADLVKGIGAAYAAILGDDGRDWRVLAAEGIDPDKTAALLADPAPADLSSDPFPIRHQLADQLQQPDLLAIGPRSDGASYTKDERLAIKLIIEPLSNAIQAAALRERHIVKVETSLDGIDQRLARLEQGLAREP